MNNYFVSKVIKIQENLPPQTDDPLKTLKKVMKNKNTIFSLEAVSPDTVKQIISGLKNSKSSGIDNLDTYVIKLIVDEILPAVTHIVNLSIQKSVFPTLY